MLILLRFIGVWLLLVAMVAAVVDATKSLAGGGTWVVTPMGEQWKAINAPSLDAVKAWIVGHAGVILRTTDGVSWHRVVSPNATITDWTGVTAGDAQHATITAKDQHRFTTNDGGQIWTPQP